MAALWCKGLVLSTFCVGENTAPNNVENPNIVPNIMPQFMWLLKLPSSPHTSKDGPVKITRRKLDWQYYNIINSKWTHKSYKCLSLFHIGLKFPGLQSSFYSRFVINPIPRVKESSKSDFGSEVSKCALHLRDSVAIHSGIYIPSLVYSKD